MSRAFNATLVSTFSPDRLYRIYVDRGEVFFIRIGGQNVVATALASHLGLLGIFIRRALKKRADAKLAMTIAELDRQHPSSHLAAHKHNLHTPTTAIETSVLEPAAVMGAHGNHVGRWRLKLRESKEMLFQLETLEEMKAAHALLPTIGGLHVTNVVWDPAKEKFTKAAAQVMTAAR